MPTRAAVLLLCILLYTSRVNAAGLAEEASPDTYELVARIEAPPNITFPGGAQIAEQCLRALQGFSQPAVPRLKWSREDILSVLPAWSGGKTPSMQVGEVFTVANDSTVLAWLSQLHPGARRSRYHPLDPAVRAEKTAVGILAEESESELLFLFRIHAEFKVASTTPALFVMPGRFDAVLRVPRDFEAIHELHIYVPTDNTFNVLFECGDPFVALGDDFDAAPSSPDARRLSEFKIPFMRREPAWVSEAGEGIGDDAHDSGNDEEWGPGDDGSCSTASLGARGNEEEAATFGREVGHGDVRAGGAREAIEGGQGGEAERAALHMGASAKMGLSFYPGEDVDFVDETAEGVEGANRGQGEAASAAHTDASMPAFVMSLQVCVLCTWWWCLLVSPACMCEVRLR